MRIPALILALLLAAAVGAAAAPASPPAPRGTVFLDPGHGGDDPGVHVGGFEEAPYVLDLARDLAKLLRADGYAAVLSRDSAQGLSLGARVAAANASGADVLLSLHVNRAFQKEADGPRFFVPAPGPVDEPAAPLWEQAGRVHAKESRELAMELARAVHARGGRPVQTLKMGLFRGAAMPACVAELGFANDPDELKGLTDKASRQDLLRQLAHGLESYLTAKRGSHAP